VHSPEPVYPNPIKLEFVVAPSGRRVSQAARNFDLSTGKQAAARTPARSPNKHRSASSELPGRWCSRRLSRRQVCLPVVSRPV